MKTILKTTKTKKSMKTKTTKKSATKKTSPIPSPSTIWTKSNISPWTSPPLLAGSKEPIAILKPQQASARVFHQTLRKL